MNELQQKTELVFDAVSSRVPLAQKTLASADIAARLNTAQKEAARLSLSAKNLAVVATRLGSAGVGLKTLSGFYDELANSTIKISREINRQAGVIASNSVALWRKFMFCDCLLRVNASMVTRTDLLLEQKLISVKSAINFLTKHSQDESQRLAVSIAELDQQMRSMQVIVVNARIEASTLPKEHEQLAELTSQIQRATNAILAEVRCCQYLLKDLE